MKRVLVFLLIMAMLFSVTACAKPAEVETAPAAETAGLEDSANDYFASFPGSRIVDWADVATMIEAGEEPFILSIRQEDVYNEGHVEGAYLAAWGQDLADKVDMLPTDQTVYVYCYTGQTAGQTVALLNILGVDAVSIKSGYNNGISKAEGYEAFVETEANELPDAGAEFDPETLAFVKDYFASVGDNANYIMAADEVAPLAESGDVVVMDIRSAEDFAKGHVDGAVNVPFGQGMQEQFPQFEGEKIVVACYSGQTAGQTTAVLRALGYNAYSMKSGMGASGWGAYAVKMAANNYFADFPGSRIITWEDIFAKMDAGENPFILSIRQADVYSEGHIKGAALAAWGTDLAEKVAMLPNDKPVYVYCYTGQTAGQTVALLNMLGIEAYSIKSGYVNGAMAVDGYEAYVDTEAVELTDAGASYDPSVLAFVQGYFNSVADNANFIMAAEDATAVIDAGEISVVDIRSAEDFAAGHIAGAMNIPFGSSMQESFSNLPEGKLLVTCYTGQTAGQTIAILRALGYDAVSLKGGMNNGWNAAELPVVTE